MTIVRNNRNLKASKSKKCKIIKSGIATLAVVLLIGVTKHVSIDDSMNQDVTTLAEQLMKGVNPIDTTIFDNVEVAAVYLDNEGNRIFARSDYQILECNGMGYTHIGYVFETEKGVELFYTKEEVDTIKAEEIEIFKH